MLHLEVFARFIVLKNSLQDTAEFVENCDSFRDLKLKMAWLNDFK